MAKLRVFQSIQDNKWTLTFESRKDDFTSVELIRMQQYGEPEINVGGVFLKGTNDEYTFPDKYIRIKGGLPYTKKFDPNTPEFEDNTQAKVEAYRDDFITKYGAAISNLVSKPDTFTGEHIYNI